MEKLWQNLMADEVIAKVIVGVFVALIVSTLMLVVKPIRNKIFSSIKNLLNVFRAIGILHRVNSAVDGKGVWTTEPVVRPKKYAEFYNNPIPILTVANLKGGVGKTTAAVNLGAYFAAERNERVLLIDLDYQGSMSSMLLTRESRVPANQDISHASKLIIGRDETRNLSTFSRPVRHAQMERAYAIPAFYDLANTENREMIHWLTKKRNFDVRYTLADILHQPVDKREFDRVIIDAPPRLTTSTIQALCASTHVLIPTVLDALSGEAVATFVRELVERRPILWPNLKFAGVSAQLVSANLSNWRDNNPDEDDPNVIISQLTASERQGLALIKTSLDRLKHEFENDMPRVDLLPPETFIAKRAPIAQSAGKSVAFLDISNDLKGMFRALGQEIETRMNIDQIY